MTVGTAHVDLTLMTSDTNIVGHLDPSYESLQCKTSFSCVFLVQGYLKDLLLGLFDQLFESLAPEVFAAK